ncbi:MAG: VF530 family protein [Crocinitomicaceae bacterium]|nr:VF530 family protein [Crocinitomicaceae bacterium]
MESENNNEQKTTTKKVRRQATQEELNHPLHGVKLATVLETLVEVYGWKYLAQEVNINCFKYDPSIKVSLKFLRKFAWAREHVQDIYVDMVEQGIDQKVKKRN